MGKTSLHIQQKAGREGTLREHSWQRLGDVRGKHVEVMMSFMMLQPLVRCSTAAKEHLAPVVAARPQRVSTGSKVSNHIHVIHGSHPAKAPEEGR